MKNKSGIYQIINNLNNKFYIGSSINLRRRIAFYYGMFNLTRKNRGESKIHNALLKYGYLSFSFTILEFVDISSLNSLEAFKKILTDRELHFINTLNPQYNILKTAGSSLGHKLSEETRLKMSKAKKGLSSHRKGSKHSEETKLLVRQNSGTNKTVYMFSKDKKLIAQFYSIANAA